MKKISLLALLLSFVVIGFTSCSKSNSGPSSTTKTIVTQTSTPNLDMSVTFKAVETGDGSVSQITYTDGTGNVQTVNSPTLPWSKTVQVTAGVDVKMTAVVTYTNGFAKISYSGSGSSGGSSESISGSASTTGTSSK